MTKAAALHSFFSSFGLTAYEENSVPTGAEFPYLTYNVITDSIGNEVSLSCSLWYRSKWIEENEKRYLSNSWLEANAKAEQISLAISSGGKTIPCDGGAVWLKRGSPFAQSMGDDSDNLIKRKLLNITAEFLTFD